MTARRNRPFDLSPLGHPAWWGALALLLVNDNLLKGRHVVPGWLTGKLSDFAFLIVAPVLLAALLPVAVRARRTVAMLSAVGVFVAKDLSAPFSDEVVALAGQVGLHWRLWSDPTDLLALLVLPLTARIMWGDSDAKTTPRRPMRLACERFGGLVGAVACLATSAGPSFPHSPFFVNRLPTTAALRMTWVLRDIDCQATAASVAASLLPSDLDDPITLSVGSGQVATLDGPSPPGTSPVGLCSFKASASQACVGVIVESGTASPVLMVAPMQWVSFDGASICQSSFGTSANPGPDALSLGSVNGVPTFAAGSMLQIAPLSPADVVPRTPQADGCRPTRAAYEGLVSQDTCRCPQSMAVPALSSTRIRRSRRPPCSPWSRSGRARASLSAHSAGRPRPRSVGPAFAGPSVRVWSSPRVRLRAATSGCRRARRAMPTWSASRRTDSSAPAQMGKRFAQAWLPRAQAALCRVSVGRSRLPTARPRRARMPERTSATPAPARAMGPTMKRARTPIRRNDVRVCDGVPPGTGPPAHVSEWETRLPLSASTCVARFCGPPGGRRRIGRKLRHISQRSACSAPRS
jgi:hypothetical protein